MKKKKLFSLAKKAKSYYSIYPSFLAKHNMKYKNDIKIKIFKDLNAPGKFCILPVKFCPVRNCHVFDIQKNKFHSNNKLMNFTFISHNNKVAIDPSYKIIQYGDEYVNQMNFKKFDEGNDKNINYLNFSFEEKESSESDSNSFSDYEDNSGSEKDENIGIKNCLTFNIKSINKCNNSKLDLLSNTFSNSTKDSIRINSPGCRKIKRKRTKSILKNKNGSKSIPKKRESRSITKRVSFGSSQISFYKSQIIK